ncbi:TolC family protein [Candidatus Dependentiae bacterium]
MRKEALYYLVIVTILFTCYRTMPIPKTNKIFSRKTLHLDNLLSHALSNNPRVSANNAIVKAMELRAKRARLPQDPKFKYQSKDNEHLGQCLFKRERRYGIYQKVPFPGKLKLKKEIKLQNAAFIASNREEEVLELILKLKTLYYELYIAHFVKNIKKQNKTKISNVLTTINNKKVRLHAHIKIQKIQEGIHALEGEQKSIETNINALLNQQLSTYLGTPKPIFHEKITFDINKLEALALKNRPDIAGHSALIIKHEKRAKLARRNYFPDFDLEFIIQRKKDYDRYAWYVKIGFDIPIWARQKQKRESDESECMALARKLELQNLRNKIMGNIRSLVLEIQALNKNISLYKKEIIPAAEKILELEKSSINAIIELQEENIYHEKLLVKREILLAKLEKQVGIPLF